MTYDNYINKVLYNLDASRGTEMSEVSVGVLISGV